MPANRAADQVIIGGGDGLEGEAAGADGGEDAWVEPNVVADPSRSEWERPGDEDEELQLGGGEMEGRGAMNQGVGVTEGRSLTFNINPQI